MPAVNIRLELYKRAIRLDIDIVEVINQKLEEIIIERERERDEER